MREADVDIVVWGMQMLKVCEASADYHSLLYSILIIIVIMTLDLGFVLTNDDCSVWVVLMIGLCLILILSTTLLVLSLLSGRSVDACMKIMFPCICLLWKIMLVVMKKNILQISWFGIGSKNNDDGDAADDAVDDDDDDDQIWGSWWSNLLVMINDDDVYDDYCYYYYCFDFDDDDDDGGGGGDVDAEDENNGYDEGDDDVTM